MPICRSKLLESLIRKKLYEEVEHILAISHQGFDVYAKTTFPEVKTLLIELLKQELKTNSRAFHIISSVEELKFDENFTTSEMAFLPTVLVGEHSLSPGSGFVTYHVAAPDSLIGNVAICIDSILKYFNLEFYLDVFDATKLSRLKQIARTQGVKSLIDAVVQSAYLGGFKGDMESAQEYLDKTQFSTGSFTLEKNVQLENCAKIFLSYAVAHGENAHCFLKSCLSYYIVNNQGHTMSRASQILDISRTTLQEHLKLAHKLKVSAFFEGQFRLPH